MSSATPSTPICRFTAIAGADPYVRVIPSEPIKASRGISTERRTRGRGVNTPNFSLQNVTLRHWIATFLLRSHKAFAPCGLLTRQSTRLAKLRCPRLWRARRHTALRWSRLHFAQDDTDRKSRMTGEHCSPLRDQTKRHCRGDHWSPVGGTMPFPQATRLLAFFLAPSVEGATR